MVMMPESCQLLVWPVSSGLARINASPIALPPFPPCRVLPFIPPEAPEKPVFPGIPWRKTLEILDCPRRRFTMKGRLVVSKLPDAAGPRKDCRHVGAVSEEERKHRHQQ